MTTPDVSVRGPDELRPFDGAPANATWEAAFETDRTLLVRTRVDAGTATEWYATGERDAYGVVLGGRGRIEYGPDASDGVDLTAGEFFCVPAGVTHRHVATGAEASVCLVAVVGSGPAVVAAERPTAAPDRTPRAAGESELVPTGQLANLTRLTPFPDAAVQQIRGHATGRVASEWHHHGDNDVFGYVVEGEGYVEWGEDEGERTLARTGEFFRVPAGVVHRDVNPSETDQRYVLWLTGSEPRVVRVDGPAEG